MIRAVIFDIDGTMVNHDGARQAALARLYGTLEEARRVSLDEFVATWHREDSCYWEQYQAGEITFAQQRLLRVKAVFGCLGESISDETAMSVFETYLAAYEQSWKLYDDVLPCLKSLNGYRLAVISNGDSDQQRRKLAQTNIASYFSSVVISGDLGVSKPHPDIFKRGLQALNLPPQEAIYVGDRLEADALGAEGVGMHGVWLAREGYEGDPADLPVPVIESLAQMKTVLARF